MLLPFVGKISVIYNMDCQYEPITVSSLFALYFTFVFMSFTVALQHPRQSSLSVALYTVGGSQLRQWRNALEI